jgi:hypothetical protein
MHLSESLVKSNDKSVIVQTFTVPPSYAPIVQEWLTLSLANGSHLVQVSYDGDVCRWSFEKSSRLRHVLQRTKTQSLPWSVRLMWLYEIATTLFALHNARLMAYRCLSIDDVVIQDGHAYLLPPWFSFGTFHDIRTFKPTFLAYMAPEWFFPNLMFTSLSDPRMDCYSYGVLMYAIGTQVLPWAKLTSSLPQLVYAVASGKRPSLPSKWNGTNDFRDLMNKCWSQEADQRPSMMEVCTALMCLDLQRTMTVPNAKNAILLEQEIEQQKQEERSDEATVLYASALLFIRHKKWMEGYDDLNRYRKLITGNLPFERPSPQTDKHLYYLAICFWNLNNVDEGTEFPCFITNPYVNLWCDWAITHQIDITDCSHHKFLRNAYESRNMMKSQAK